MDNIIFNEEMTLAIAIASELDPEEFKTLAEELHAELTGESIYLENWNFKNEDGIYRLEIKRS